MSTTCENRRPAEFIGEGQGYIYDCSGVLMTKELGPVKVQVADIQYENGGNYILLKHRILFSSCSNGGSILYFRNEQVSIKFTDMERSDVIHK